ncbi:hypothetical protein [Anthocerotibacter panamensis]|uniref:hypothetical protein n=1 Tax=Anthocerotibacter panamensis TaxID=2857077 RepID=UPI001C40778B|nr:hypothetical protein [Anthocerotibacter panamensis]
MRRLLALLLMFACLGTGLVPAVAARPEATSPKKSKKKAAKAETTRKSKADSAQNRKKRAKIFKGRRNQAKPEPVKIVLEGANVRLLNYTAFTLYAPKGSAQAAQRAQLITQRLDALLKTYAEGNVSIQAVSGPGTSARVLINGEDLTTVTQYEMQANGFASGYALAQRWSNGLRQLITKPNVQDIYFTYAGLPPSLALDGEVYRMSRQMVPDYGLFTTDGTQQNNRVIFWREGEPKPFKNVYVLNRNRKFVVYERGDERSLPPQSQGGNGTHERR